MTPPKSGASLRQILAWGLANALKQKFDLEHAALKRQRLLDDDAATIPFGSTVVQVNEPARSSPWSKLALAGALGLGLAGAGWGASAMARLAETLARSREGSRVVQPPNPREQILEGELEWEFVPDVNRTESNRTESNRDGRRAGDEPADR